MIDEKVLIERLKESANLHKYSSISHIVDGLNFAIGIVLDLAEEQNNGWIPCSERLPSKKQVVLANVSYSNPSINNGNHVIISEYRGEDFWHNGIIIAWQPLPAPYKPKGE